MNSFGWKAQFTQDWAADSYTLHIYRQVNGSTEVVEATLEAHTYTPGTATGSPGISLPSGCYEAVVDAINPPAHAAEIRRLEEALALERARVDRLLGLIGSGPQ